VCRFFALRSAVPTSLAHALFDEPTSLAAQSRCDLKGECHGSGWGIATFNGSPHVVRSTEPAYADSAFAEQSNSLTAKLALAHVRNASVGGPAIENTHPFVCGRWVFAHNGTLQGFADRKPRLLDAIPEDLRKQIGGATDSEHAFYFWLGRLRELAGDVDRPVTVESLAGSIRETILVLAEWFPAQGEEETRLNFLVTNGQLLAATRWKHSLSLLVRRESDLNGDRTVLIASEPTTRESWQEVPDRSLVIVDERLQVHSALVSQSVMASRSERSEKSP
jgi:predicted glutamine amidotransferase